MLDLQNLEGFAANAPQENRVVASGEKMRSGRRRGRETPARKRPERRRQGAADRRRPRVRKSGSRAAARRVTKEFEANEKGRSACGVSPDMPR